MSTGARPEAVLLDAGGVLLDLDYRYLRRLLAARRLEVDVARLSEVEALARMEIHRQVREGGRVGDTWRDYFRVLLGHVSVPVEHREEIIDSLWEAHERIGLWTVAIDGGPEAIGALKRSGYRLGVVSNAEGRVERDLVEAGYAGMFETVVDSCLVGVEKPDPAIFAIALERMGLSPDRTVYVGDLPAVDVEGARAAGIPPILLDRHGLYPEAGVPTIGSIGELPRLLDAGPDASPSERP